MAETTIASVGNTPTAGGLCQQPGDFYDSVNSLWWHFTLTATSTTTLYSYSSPDNITWTARATATLSVAVTDGRNLAVCYEKIGTTAVVHVLYTNGTSAAYHLRGTISGTTITWGSSVADSGIASASSPVGAAVCLDSNNHPLDWLGGGNNGDSEAWYSANADSGTSWTTGMGTGADTAVGTNNIASACLIPLSNGNVVTLVDNAGGATFPTASLTNVLAGKHSGSGFTANSSLASVFTTLGTAQNVDTWNACYVSDTAVHVVLASGTNTWTEKLLNGSSTGNTTAPTVSAGGTIPSQTFKATGGVALVYTNSTLYLFCIDSATGNDVRVISWTSGGGWGTWAGLGLASATRNYLSASRNVDGSGNILLTWTEGASTPYSNCATLYATASGTNYPRSVATTVTPADTLVRILAAARSLASTVPPVTAASRVVGFLRGIASSVTPATTVSVQHGVARSASTSVTPATTVSTQHGVARSPASAVLPSDTVSRQITFGRTVSSGVTPATAVSRVYGQPRSAVTSVTPADTVSRAEAFTRVPASSVAPADTVSRRIAAQRSAQSVVTPADTLTSAHGLPRSPASSVTPVDTVGRATGKARTSASAVTLATTVAAHRSSVRVLVTAIPPVTTFTVVAPFPPLPGGPVQTVRALTAGTQSAAALGSTTTVVTPLAAGTQSVSALGTGTQSPAPATAGTQSVIRTT